MIQGVGQSGKYVLVSGGSNSNPYISPGSVGAGMVRWNPNMNCLEVNDGAIWKELAKGFATVGLTPEAEDLLDWAKEKRSEERKIKELCEKYPGLKKAKENYDLILNIIKDENENKV